jgi:glycosyltransferase involved in cell wall biosynthesis
MSSSHSSDAILPPLVTIVIPCFNQSSYLFECAASLLRQTIPNWSAIVVDDASTRDHPKEHIERINDPRFSLVQHTSNKGLAAARNTGFSKAKTPYVLPLDSDDYISDDFLERTLAPLLKNPHLDCSFTDIQLFGSSSERWRHRVQRCEDMLTNCWLCGAGSVTRKRLWEDIGGYCESNDLRSGNEDWDFWIGAAERNFASVHVAGPLYFYRRYATSMSATTLRSNDHITRLAIYQRHKSYFDHHKAGAAFLLNGYLNTLRSPAARSSLSRRLRLTIDALPYLKANPQHLFRVARAVF